MYKKKLFKVDAFLIADKHIKIMGSNKQSYSLSQAYQDVTAHEKLTDEQVRILEVCPSVNRQRFSYHCF
jgi:hypothetical protein